MPIEILALLIVTVVLGMMIIALMLERTFIVDQHKAKEDKLLEENSRLVKAVIAKNANDYVMTASIDKVAPEEKPKIDPDLVDPDDLSDDEFDKSLGIKRTPPKK